MPATATVSADRALPSSAPHAHDAMGRSRSGGDLVALAVCCTPERGALLLRFVSPAYPAALGGARGYRPRNAAKAALG